ncbi:MULTISPECIES: Na+/H+ antiporter NhaC family protein [unclassified Microcoleus]|uniref:Na+/H+ antiporter NhaC family protein n=1 Tax=unclassified Microcoleus TaxID=2642155 RepID=UPI002FCFE2B2
MDLLFFVIISFILLLVSAIKGYFIVAPLLASMVILIAILLKRGFQLKSLIKMAVAGSKKSFSVIGILLLIGAVMAVWMAAGTVPVLVYWGIKLISPQYFIFSAFILTSIVSVLLGTSFGTASTIGVALTIAARGSGVNPNMIAGAIVAGAYFGDRCSPMSSSANLIAAITKTEIYTNLKNMTVTGLLPLIVSSLLYLILSFLNPVELSGNNLALELGTAFNLNSITLLPALTILILCVLRVEVKIAMATSVIAGSAIAIFVQGYSPIDILQFALTGFKLESTSSLKDIVAGGGILSMVKVSTVVIVSTAFAGLFAGTRTLEFIEVYLNKARSRGDLFLGTTVISILSAAFGCTQTIAILLTHQLVEEKYRKEGLDDYQLAVDLENTAVVISPLIPWNIAGLVPATVLSVNSDFIPYAFYLYLIPFFNLIEMKLAKPSHKNQPY